MQKLPTAALAGDTVEARAQRWRVERVADDPPSVAVELGGAEPGNAGTHRTLIAPYDDIEPASPHLGARRLRAGPAIGVLCGALAASVPWPAPEALLSASLDLYPHQLTASLAIRTGRARRVLVADPVGTGKTVQAAIAMLTTLRDHHDGRVLLVVPAGLKAQWCAELRARFGLDPCVVEAAEPNADGHQPAESPWRTPAWC